MGIAKFKRTTEPKEIWLDKKETVYVIGRPYAGRDFTAQSLRVSAKYRVEMRLALKNDDWDKQAEISGKIGLEGITSGANPCVVEIGDTDGFKATGKDIVALLSQDEYQYLKNEIDRVLDISSEEFALSEEDAIAEGKRLRETIIGGGARNGKKEA